jgi:hypothetical protein
MKYIKRTLGLFSLALIAACSSEDNTPSTNTGNPNEGQTASAYVFVINSLTGQEGGTKYIATAPSITEGTLRIDKNTGIETDSYSFFVQNNQLMAAVYGFSGQSPLTFYNLTQKGEIVEGTKLVTETIGSYGNIGATDVVSATLDGNLFAVNTELKQITHKGAVDFTKLKYKDEESNAYNLTGVFAVGTNKLYIPYSVSPKEGDTKYRDNSFIAVVDYPSLKIDKTIIDDRSGLIGSWFGMNGIQQVENGAVYAWSPAEKSKNPSAFFRIKNHEIDKDYFFDVQKATGGHKLSRAEYIGSNVFLVSFFVDKDVKDTWRGVTKLALVNVETKAIQWIETIPEHQQMAYKQKIYVEKDKKTVHYVAPIENTNRFQVYNIDVASATAKKGITIENALDVTAISKLESVK